MAGTFADIIAIQNDISYLGLLARFKKRAVMVLVGGEHLLTG